MNKKIEFETESLAFAAYCEVKHKAVVTARGNLFLVVISEISDCELANSEKPAREAMRALKDEYHKSDFAKFNRALVGLQAMRREQF